jgi:hypothetical protein
MGFSRMLRVNKNNLCPICERPDWCLVAEDGSAAICSRISEGSTKKAGDAGWLHILIDRPLPQRRKYVKPRKATPVIDWTKLAAEYCCNFEPKAMGQVVEEKWRQMFGVSMTSLDELLIGWDPAKKAHTFPMFDGKKNMIGIRLRTPDGNQFSVPGSKNGLFWPLSTMADTKELLFICEGPTDTAALLDMRFSPIGRPSCGAGFQYIKEMIEHHNRQVVIFADKDTAHFTPAGKKYFPGYDGGLKLAQDIKPFVSSVRVIKPPRKKDIRAWYQAGATRAAVLAIVKHARFI